MKVKTAGRLFHTFLRFHSPGTMKEIAYSQSTIDDLPAYKLYLAARQRPFGVPIPSRAARYLLLLVLDSKSASQNSFFLKNSKKTSFVNFTITTRKKSIFSKTNTRFGFSVNSRLEICHCMESSMEHSLYLFSYFLIGQD